MIPLSLDRQPRPSPAWRIFKASLWHDRFWILLFTAATLAGAGAVAVKIEPLYRAESTVLVLLGSEYTYRTVAGENSINAGALTRDQILRTEIEILQEDNLHRDVINTIGAGVLYPELLAPPGLAARIKLGLTAALYRLQEAAGLEVEAPAAARPVNLSETALLKFDENLGFRAVKDGNVVEVTFTHENPEMAARVLALLEERYLRRRRELYLSQEGALVGRAVDNIRTQLEIADANLARFKKDKGINDYLGRRTILLNQQGALETDLRLVQNQVDQSAARVVQLEQQIRTFPGAYNTLTNPLMLQAQQDRSKAQVDLHAARAQVNVDAAQLGEVASTLAQLNSDEQQLEQLTRTRDILADDYKAASVVRHERELTDSVELNRKDNVRVLQDPRPPLRPLPTRMLILSVGAVLAMMVGAAVGVLMHAFRRVYLVPEALEHDTGLRVLISVPNSRQLAKANLILGLR